MKLFALKMKVEGFHKGRWMARQEFGVKYSDVLNKARLFTEKDLRDYQKYCEQAQQTFSFSDVFEVVEVSIVEREV